MGWTQQQLDDLLASNPNVRVAHAQVRDQGTGSSPVLQEQQTDCHQPQDGEAVHHVQPQEKEVDGRGYPQFRVSITYLVSDYRRRDAWGMAETVADCIVAAARRLLGADVARKPRGGARAKGAGGLLDNDGED